MIQTKEQLAARLRQIADAVEAGDSYQGHISYDFMEDGLKHGEVEVSGAYRVGNLQGQGGMAMIDASPRNEDGSLVRP